jgi:UDP-N-acetylglucosamine--N-acetylmuramyl-(pentapeptide) pyrophosphoryl-undecaprenol N-acetylglucosamine transferase
MGTGKTRLAITGGGTGGHVSPAVAVIEALRRRLPEEDLELLYIGGREGTEARIVPLMGVEYRGVSTGKLRRYLSIANLTDALRVPLGVVEALVHLARFRPRALLATGGYVSVPAVVAAWLLRKPILVHEQTGALGLANRINARLATRVALSVSGSERGLKRDNWVVTGNPVRAAVRAGDRATAARRFRFSPELPTVYVTGGAQGAHAINRAILGALRPLLETAQVIHQCGDSEGTRADYEQLVREVAELDASLQARYALLRFVGQEIGEVYALADVVVGRAGAGTVNELATLGKPAILIPLPHAAGDEQRHNARRMAQAGAAVVIEESELTPERLVTELRTLLADPERLRRMSAAGQTIGSGDAAEKLADLLLELARGG